MLQVSSSDYWLSSTAISITLNALGDKDYIQSSVSSGSKLLCYINHIADENIKATFGYDEGHNYRRWSIRSYPTAFGTESDKYVYLRIPRTYSSDSAIAEIVYPSILLDIYGRVEVPSETTPTSDSSPSSDGDSSPSSSPSTDSTSSELVQYADDSYYYLYLGGHISASTSGARHWISSVDTGLLATDQDIAAGPKDTWYRYDILTDTVTFLKDVISATITNLKSTTAEISNLIFGGKTLTGTAQVATTSIDGDSSPSYTDINEAIAAAIAIDGTSDEVLITPAAASQRYLSRITDDTAFGNITFNGNITAEQLAEFKSSVRLYKDTTHYDSSSSDTFVGGMLGSGWNVDRDGNAELQSLTVREFLQVPEIRFNRADILIGTNIQSVCGGVIKSVTQTSETGGVAELELGDDDLAGSIAVGDLCWGYFHDYGESKDTNNATEDSDDCKGEINYKGFATVYFQVSEIMNGNSTKFRYELRPDLDDDNKQKYTLHPFVGMHFGGRGNTTDKDRQGFTITTPNYTATYQLVSSWDWSDVAKYIVRVSGRLDGFEDLAMKEAGTWKNHYGTIDCNFYLRGSIQQVANTRRYIYITQQSNGMIDPGETEHVSIKIRDHYFQDVTAQFDILVKDMLFDGEEEVEIDIAYDDLQSDVTYYDVTATSHEQGTDGEPLYTLTSRFIIRRNPEQVLTIYTNIDNDPFIDNIEPKHIECGLRNNLGYDLTSAVTKWSIERISSDAAADAIWATRTKVVYFDGSIDIYWSDDVEVNDIDLTAPTTKFRVTATIGDVEATTTINI